MVTTIFSRKGNKEATSDSSLANTAAAGADPRAQHEAMGSLSPNPARHSRLASLLGLVSGTEENARELWRIPTNLKFLSPCTSSLVLISCWGEASTGGSQEGRQ